MSLNGLEAAEVNEAYRLALEEGGGWYVQKRLLIDNNRLKAFSAGFCSNTSVEMK